MSANASSLQGCPYTCTASMAVVRGYRRLNRFRIKGIVIRFNVYENRADFVPVKGVGGGYKVKGVVMTSPEIPYP